MDSLVALNVAQYLPLHAHNLFLYQLGLEEHSIPSYVGIKRQEIGVYLMLLPTEYCRELLCNRAFVEHVILNAFCPSLFTEKMIAERIIPFILGVKGEEDMKKMILIINHCMRRATIRVRYFFYDRLGVHAETDDIHRHAVIASILHRFGHGFDDYMKQIKDARYADYAYHYDARVGNPSCWAVNNHVFASPVGATMDVIHANLSKTIATIEKAIGLGYETFVVVGNGPIYATILLPLSNRTEPFKDTAISFIKSYYNVAE